MLCLFRLEFSLYIIYYRCTDRLVQRCLSTFRLPSYQPLRLSLSDHSFSLCIHVHLALYVGCDAHVWFLLLFNHLRKYSCISFCMYFIKSLYAYMCISFFSFPLYLSLSLQSPSRSIILWRFWRCRVNSLASLCRVNWRRKFPRCDETETRSGNSKFLQSTSMFPNMYRSHTFMSGEYGLNTYICKYRSQICTCHRLGQNPLNAQLWRKGHMRERIKINLTTMT